MPTPTQAAMLTPRAGHLGRCRSCFAQIIWTTNTVTGSKMPIDVPIVAGGNVLVDLSQADATCTVHKDPVVAGRMSHHATCPQSAQWRRGSRR